MTTAKDLRNYSLREVLLAQAEGRPIPGYAREISDQCASHWRTGHPNGLYIPLGGLISRDLNVTTASQGGDFVQTSIATPIIELLRNKLVCLRLGATALTFTQGNVAIPRQTSTATPYTLSESETLTKSTQAIDQVMLTPHRVSASTEFTKQLLLQSSVDVEQFIRDDLTKSIATKWDKLILEGDGSGSNPTGILHTSGVGSVTFGAAPTYAKAVAFETALATANADMGRMAYVTSPGVRGAWKVTPKIGSTFPIFLWEDGEWNDATNDGRVAGYRAAATNQVSNNKVFFGDFTSVVFATFGGCDVVVNPYSRDVDAVVRITVSTWCDVALRHPASFAVSSDAGNQ